MSNYEYTKKWKKENPEKVKEQQRRYYKNHKEEYKKRSSKYARARAEKRFNDNIEELAKYIEKNGF